MIRSKRGRVLILDRDKSEGSASGSYGRPEADRAVRQGCASSGGRPNSSGRVPAVARPTWNAEGALPHSFRLNDPIANSHPLRRMRELVDEGRVWEALDRVGSSSIATS